MRMNSFFLFLTKAKGQKMKDGYVIGETLFTPGTVFLLW